MRSDSSRQALLRRVVSKLGGEGGGPGRES